MEEEINQRPGRSRTPTREGDADDHTDEADDDLDGFIVPDDAFIPEDEEYEVGEAVPRTMMMERIQRRVTMRRRMEASIMSETASSTTNSPRKRTTRKRKSVSKKKTTRKSSKNVKKKITKRKSTSRKTRGSKHKITTGKGKGKGKGKSNEVREKKASKEENNSSQELSLSIFGDKNDLNFFGDDESAYANPQPGPSTSYSHVRAKEVFLKQDSSYSGSQDSVDVLGGIISSQNKVFKASSDDCRLKKLPSEVYRKTDADVLNSPSEAISTSVTRQEREQKKRREVIMKRMRLEAKIQEDLEESVETKAPIPRPKIIPSSSSSRLGGAATSSSSASLASVAPSSSTANMSSSLSRTSSCSDDCSYDGVVQQTRAPERFRRPLSAVNDSSSLELTKRRSKDDLNHLASTKRPRIDKYERLGEIKNIVKHWLRPHFMDRRFDREMYKRIMSVAMEKTFDRFGMTSKIDRDQVKFLVDGCMEARSGIK